jgi:PIN domain nuclease of toxin-antitoxin system
VRLLLDTHIWLWSFLEPEHLGRRVQSTLEDQGNELWLSAIKASGKRSSSSRRTRVAVDTDSASWLGEALETASLNEAPLTFDIARESRVLRLPHPDPADRFIAATARVSDLTLATADERLAGCREIAVFGRR